MSYRQWISWTVSGLGSARALACPFWRPRRKVSPRSCRRGFRPQHARARALPSHRAAFRCSLAGVFLVWLGAVALPWATASAAGAAPPKKADAEGWVAVPASFLAARLVRAPQGPATVYRVILDVPAASSAAAARPRVTQSCGEEAVDGIAWDYVKATLAGNVALAEQNRRGELRFQLKLTPTALDVSHLKVPPEYAGIPADSIVAPAPRFPAAARRGLETGSGKVKAKFPASGGTPLRVTLIESTGSHTLDIHTVQWAMLAWRAPKAARELEIVIPFTYVSR